MYANRVRCADCITINEQLRKHCDTRNHFENQQWKHWFDLYIRHDPETHITAEPVKRTHKGNGKHKGIFAGTLTMSSSDTTNESEMCHAINKIMTQKTVPLKRYAWYVEKTDAGLPHIHFIYETTTGGRIHKKIFERYWKIWDEDIAIGRGHRGGFHEAVVHEDAYAKYIAKDGGRHVNKWSTEPN